MTPTLKYNYRLNTEYIDRRPVRFLQIFVQAVSDLKSARGSLVLLLRQHGAVTTRHYPYFVGEQVTVDGNIPLPNVPSVFVPEFQVVTQLDEFVFAIVRLLELLFHWIK